MRRTASRRLRRIEEARFYRWKGSFPITLGQWQDSLRATGPLMRSETLLVVVLFEEFRQPGTAADFLTVASWTF
jgi:hypothetical protein